MKPTKYLKYKGVKTPVFNTPLSKPEIWELRDKFERFIIHDVRRGTIKFYSGEQVHQKFVLDFGFKHVAYIVGGVFVLYNLFTAKRGVERKIKEFRPLRNGKENFEKTLNGWSIEEVTKDGEQAPN